MKANKAPEKIYISTNSQDSTYYISNQYKRLIEYVRTDAFIEKAWDWIEDNLLSANQQDKSCLYYEQFINYMRGE